MFFLQLETRGDFPDCHVRFLVFFYFFERVLAVGKPIGSMGLVALKSNLP